MPESGRAAGGVPATGPPRTANPANVSNRLKVDISEATVVTLFLLEGLNLQLLPKLQRELKPGTRIVSHHFDMGDAWPPDLAQDVGGLMTYVWTVR